LEGNNLNGHPFGGERLNGSKTQNSVHPVCLPGFLSKANGHHRKRESRHHVSGCETLRIQKAGLAEWGSRQSRFEGHG
jgi:hypothetical protein